MHTRARVATAIATGVVATALLASPSLAAGLGGGAAVDQAGGHGQQNAQHPGTCDGTGAGMGNRSDQDGRRMGGQGRGAGMGSGTRADLTNVAGGTLTDPQKSALAGMAEDEKLAHDLFIIFAEKYSTPEFTRIAHAETRHLAEVRIVLRRYDVNDPTADQAVGTFTTANSQKLYDELLAQGSAGVDEADTAARTVESTDIEALKSAIVGVTAPDVLQVYANLLAGSQRHLVGFGG